jgi:cytoskeletal protein RodZ
MQPAESPAVTLGSYLRSLREAKGSSLEDMARSTRVGIRHLEALEEERLADLPSPVFVRGFIRAYCSFLRESPEPALGHYQDLVVERAAAEAASTPPRPHNTWASSSVLVGLSLLVVLGIGLVAINLAVKKQPGSSSPESRSEPVTTAPAAPPVAQPTGPSNAVAPAAPHAPPPAATVEPARPATPAPAPPPSSSASQISPVAARAATGSHRLVIRAVEPTWVRVQTDEGRVGEELLAPGASREWTAERRFLLTIGNAGGVEVTLNGRALPPLGAKGSVIQRLELPQAAASGW